MKLNKKGFTLIEMLVVIAIIAILVAIIIPTVMSSTGKASAAANAANLRALKAEITVSTLSEDGAWSELDLDTAGDYTITAGSDAEAAVKNAFGDDSAKFTLTVNDDQTFTVKFDGKTIAEWAEDAA